MRIATRLVTTFSFIMAGIATSELILANTHRPWSWIGVTSLILVLNTTLWHVFEMVTVGEIAKEEHLNHLRQIALSLKEKINEP